MLSGEFGGLQRGRAEGAGVGEVVICRAYQHYCIAVALGDSNGGYEHGGGSVAAFGLEDYLLALLELQPTHLLGDDEAMLAIADDGRGLGLGESCEAELRLLQERVLGFAEGVELLGVS